MLGRLAADEGAAGLDAALGHAGHDLGNLLGEVLPAGDVVQEEQGPGAAAHPVSYTHLFIHTYKCDGNPIPSYEGEPTLVAIEGGIDDFTASLWENLNQDNKVSLFVRTIDLATGATDTRIVNKNQ